MQSLSRAMLSHEWWLSEKLNVLAVKRPGICHFCSGHVVWCLSSVIYDSSLDLDIEVERTGHVLLLLFIDFDALMNQTHAGLNH